MPRNTTKEPHFFSLGMHANPSNSNYDLYAKFYPERINPRQLSIDGSTSMLFHMATIKTVRKGA